MNNQLFTEKWAMESKKVYGDFERYATHIEGLNLLPLYEETPSKCRLWNDKQWRIRQSYYHNETVESTHSLHQQLHTDDVIFRVSEKEENQPTPYRSLSYLYDVMTYEIKNRNNVWIQSTQTKLNSEWLAHRNVSLYGYDWIGSCLLRNQQTESAVQYATNAIQRHQTYPHVQTFFIDGTFAHSTGITMVHEVGLLLSQLTEWYKLIEKKGAKAASILKDVTFQVMTTEKVFLESIKLRALRLLLHEWSLRYVGKGKRPNWHIHTMTSPRGFTLSNNENNSIRSTLSTMGSIWGGADSVEVLPIDVLVRQGDAKNVQLALQTPHILREESGLTGRDVVYGSFFIENVTRQLCERAWHYFVGVEKKGGFLTYIQTEEWKQLQRNDVQQRQEALFKEEMIRVGVQRYGTHEVTDNERDDFTMYRDAAPYERIRNELQKQCIRTFYLEKENVQLVTQLQAIGLQQGEIKEEADIVMDQHHFTTIEALYDYIVTTKKEVKQ